MSIPMDQIVGMPAFSPYYPQPPSHYRNVKAQYVSFRAAVEAVDQILPDCFEPAEDGFCIATGLTVPWSSNYGKFDESVLTVRCTFRGQVGYFSPVAFLNSRSSIPAGREIYGTPKVFADLAVGMDERVMYTATRIAGASILSIRSTMQREIRVEDVPNLQPSWRLKVLPRADGQGNDVMQLINCSSVAVDSAVRVCRAGDGVVQFDPSPVYDLSNFRPLEYHDAWYIESDFTEGYGEIVHDFLQKH